MAQGKPGSNCELFNLGTGNGVTVLEAIRAFERITGKKLDFQLAERRPGDVIAVFANNDKAKKLIKWNPKYSLDDMMKTAWDWELHMTS